MQTDGNSEDAAAIATATVTSRSVQRWKGRGGASAIIHLSWRLPRIFLRSPILAVHLFFFFLEKGGGLG